MAGTPGYPQALSATTLSHAAVAPALLSPTQGGRGKATAAIHLKAMPTAVRATSAATPSSSVVAATTLRSMRHPATPAKLSPALSSSARSSSPRVHALPAVALNVTAAPALTIHSTDLTPLSSGGKKRRRGGGDAAKGGSRGGGTAYARGSATDTHAASLSKRFTYDAAQLVKAEPAQVPPSSPLTLSAPYPRRRFSTVSTTSSVSGASMGSEDSTSSAPQTGPLGPPFLTTEDLARLTGPRAARSQSICATTALVVMDAASKRRRSCAAVDLSHPPPPPPHPPQHQRPRTTHSPPPPPSPPPPSTHPVSRRSWAASTCPTPCPA